MRPLLGIAALALLFACDGVSPPGDGFCATPPPSCCMNACNGDVPAGSPTCIHHQWVCPTGSVSSDDCPDDAGLFCEGPIPATP